MPAYVLMKAFENAPVKYDGAMEVLTLGRIGRLKAEMTAVAGGDHRRVLDVGCGAGSLAIALAGTGAQVVGIDVSEPMLGVARQRVAAAHAGDQVELRRLSVMEIDTLPRASFDAVVGVLVLSELSDDEVRFVLSAARGLLAPGGQLLIADEVVPARRLQRWSMAVLRSPLQLATYLITQLQSLSTTHWGLRALYFAIELPLMLLVFLCVPPVSRPLRNLERRVERAGFRIARVSAFLGGSLQLIQAVRA
jgi:demethylmenaquinone methyltransferase/2-methoxy-6-polyprenyl-1,4-benzoquinol methylase